MSKSIEERLDIINKMYDKLIEELHELTNYDLTYQNALKHIFHLANFIEARASMWLVCVWRYCYLVTWKKRGIRALKR